MLGVDTNVVVRYIVGDDPDQTMRARALVDGHRVFLAVSVVLETEWVLRTVYNGSRGLVLERLKAFAGHPNVTVQNEDDVARAFEWALRGLDLADAIHLTTIGQCESFVSFDQALVKKAARLQPIPLRSP